MAIQNPNLSTYISLTREFHKHISVPTQNNVVMDQGKYITRASFKKLTERKYHVQDRKDFQHTSVKISCATTRFLVLPCCGTHMKYHVARGLSKHYHMKLDLKLGHNKYKMKQIHCVCVSYINVLDKPWSHVVYHAQEPLYMSSVEVTCWPVSGFFNNWNIIQLNNKTKFSEYFDVVHNLFLGSISANMESLLYTSE